MNAVWVFVPAHDDREQLAVFRTREQCLASIEITWTRPVKVVTSPRYICISDEINQQELGEFYLVAFCDAATHL